MSAAGRVVRSRPAEATGGVGGLAGVVAGLLSGDWKVAVAAVAGFLPAAVTYLKANHGLKGVWRSIWNGG